MVPTGGLPRWQPQPCSSARALRSALRACAIDAVRGRPGIRGDPAWLELEESWKMLEGFLFVETGHNYNVRLVLCIGQTV